MSPAPPTSSSRAKFWSFEASTLAIALVFAIVCFSSLELSWTWFVVVNVAAVAYHAYFLGRAVWTSEYVPGRYDAFYSIASSTALIVSALFKYVRVDG